MAGTVAYNDPSVRIIPSRYLGGTEDVSEWMRNNIADGRTIEVPSGSTIRWAERVAVSNVSNVTFRGSGKFKAYGLVSRAMLELTGGCANWRFNGTHWDCSQVDQDDTYQPYLTFYNGALFVVGEDNEGIYLRDCVIDDVYTDALYFYQGKGTIVIDNCAINAAAHRKQQAGQLLTLASWSNADVQVTNSRFLCEQPVDSGNNFDPAFGHGGIYITGVGGLRNRITGNTFENVGRDNDTGHRIGVVDFYDSGKNFEVSGNYMLSNWVALRVSRSQDIDFHDNQIDAYGSPTDGGILGAATGILTGSTIGYAQRVRINRNSIQYVGPSSYAGSVAIQFSCSHNDGAIIDCEAIGNTIENCLGGIYMTGSVDGLKIHDNTTRGVLTGTAKADYGGAGGTAANRRMNNVSIKGNKFLRSAGGQGCTSGIAWALPNPYTGIQKPLAIEGNVIECHDQATNIAITTFGSDVYLRDNTVDKANIGYYVRGLSTNFVRTKGNYATNVNQLEDFYLADVTREQPIANASSLKLDNLSPAAVYSSQRKLMASYSGPCMEIRESGGDTTDDIGFSLADVTDTLAINDFTAAVNGFIATLYDQSGNGNDMVQASSAAQIRAATSGAFVSLGGKFLPLGTSATYMSGGDFTLTDFTFFVVARFSNSVAGVFNFGPSNAQRLTFNGTTLQNNRVGQSASIACPYNQLVQITGYTSDSLRRIWLNGTEGTQSTDVVSASMSSVEMFYGALAASTYNMAGYIGELIIIPGTVSETNRLAIEQNQSEYWGVV